MSFSFLLSSMLYGLYPVIVGVICLTITQVWKEAGRRQANFRGGHSEDFQTRGPRAVALL